MCNENENENEALERWLRNLEERITNLERGLEAVLRKIEDAQNPTAEGHDEPGWFGVTE